MNCNFPIDVAVSRFSLNYIGHVLCSPCQEELKVTLRDSNRETIKLYFSLKKRGIPAAFEGQRTIDIAVMNTRMNIVVSEPQINYNPEKALAELQDSFSSPTEGPIRICVHNALIAYNLDETADCITGFLNSNSRRPMLYIN